MFKTINPNILTQHKGEFLNSVEFENEQRFLKFLSTLDEPLKWFFRNTTIQLNDDDGRLRVLFFSENSLESSGIYDEYNHVGINVSSKILN